MKMQNSKVQTRRDFIKASGLIGLSTYLPLNLGFSNGLLQKAGNSNNDLERYLILKEFKSSVKSPDLAGQLDYILDYAEWWALGKSKALEDYNPEGQHSYLNNFYNKIVRAEDPFQPEIPEDSGLFPIWALYKSRMMLYHTVEMSWLNQIPEKRALWYGEARRLLKLAADHFPQNKVIGIYFNQNIPWKLEKPVPASAPRWAIDQQESLEKLQKIIHWWVDQRQLPNGEYGGGWGDDVEMWRWWSPVLIGFQDYKINQAQQILSNSMLNHPRVKGGYLNQMTDVEHSAEEISDVLTPMMHIDFSNQDWKERAQRLAELMKNKWTGINQKGQLQFKSTYFSLTEVDTTPKKSCDTFYHFRAMQPVLLYWQRSQNQQLTELFLPWLETWRDAALREENGKPAGIMPTAIHWPDGKVGGIGENWWEPENTHEPIYNWPGGIEYIYFSLLLAYQISGAEKFLDPIKAAADIRKEYVSQKNPKPGIPGSLNWCASQLGGELAPVLAKYRWLTGDQSYDELLKNDANGYLQYALFNNFGAFEEELNFHADAFRNNQAIYTSEVRNTDRVIAFHRNYLKHYYENLPSPQRVCDLLMSSVTGEMGNVGYFPVNAVRWLLAPEDLAVLVTESSEEHFKARIFNFRETLRTIPAELYLLEEGNYHFEVKDESGTVYDQGEVEIGTSRVLAFEVPGERLVDLLLQKS